RLSPRCFHAVPADLPPLSLHDALPIWGRRPSPAAGPPGRRRRLPVRVRVRVPPPPPSSPTPRRPPAPPPRPRCRRRSPRGTRPRSEEHTSELQSRFDLVCRLLLEKKKH